MVGAFPSAQLASHAFYHCNLGTPPPQVAKGRFVLNGLMDNCVS